MKTATVREAQHHLAKLLAEVEKGEEIVLTRRGKQVGKLVPVKNEKQVQEVDWVAALKERDRALGDLPSLAYSPVLEERDSYDR